MAGTPPTTPRRRIYLDIYKIKFQENYLEKIFSFTIALQAKHVKILYKFYNLAATASVGIDWLFGTVPPWISLMLMIILTIFYILQFIIIKVFCPRAGLLLQTQERLQFCQRQIFLCTIRKEWRGEVKGAAARLCDALQEMV